jgi:ATP-binding cassette subfamily B protein
MTSSPDRDGARRVPEDMPPALRSMWRLCRLGYRHEPRLLVAAFLLALAAALPDALLALWISFLGKGVLAGDQRLLVVASIGLGGSAAATWILRTVSTRVQRRFRDRVTIALESHVARLQASVATIAHQERPEYLDRLSVLREQVFVLDHMYMSLFTTAGWILRLAVTIALLMSVDPALALLAVLAVPTVLTSTWRPAVERRAQEQGAQAHRLARHLFVTATTAPPGKEVRVTGIGRRLVAGRRAAWERWYGPVSRTRITSAVWHTLGWAVFGCGYVAAVVFVAAGLDAGPTAVLLVLAAGARLSAYIGATVGEIGFLRGIWMDGSRRLAWLEDYAAALVASADLPVPPTLSEGIRLEHVSFAYPGTDRLVLDDVSLDLPAGSVVAVVGENGAGKTTLVKLLCKLYEPSAGRVLVDGVPLARMPADEWRTRLAGAFQDFFRFELRARHSVGLGDVPRLDDDRAVATAVDRAGADDVIARLTAGLETQLGPTWPEGVEVSFGQWQKLALARGFMRDDPLLLILDEPTAALDAETEHALFERYAAAAHGGASPTGSRANAAVLGATTGAAVGTANGDSGNGSPPNRSPAPDGSEVGSADAPTAGESTRSRDGSGDGAGVRPAPSGPNGRITILVSHRFSTVRMADLIVVLDGARLIEVGTHDDLMARGGRYAELYGIQAAAYR